MKRISIILSAVVLSSGFMAGFAQVEAPCDTAGLVRKVKTEIKDDFNVVKDGTVKVAEKTADGTVKVYDKTKDGTVKVADKTAEGTVKVAEKTAEGAVKAYDKTKDGTVKLFDKVKKAVTK